MNDKRLQLMENAPINKAITTMAIPATAGMLLSAIYNLADTAFVSKLGTSQIGAVGIIFPLMMLISAVGMTFGMGAGSYISRLLGAKDFDLANRTASTAFFSTVFISIVLLLIGFPLRADLVVLFGATDSIIGYANEYIVYILLAMPFMMGVMVLNTMLRAEGSAKLSMIGMASGAILNIILDPIFIFVFKMGVPGAALATAISQFVSFVILITPYFKRKSVLHLKLKMFTFKLRIYGEIFKIGVPSFLRQGLASLSFVLLNSAAGLYGGDSAIAALTIMLRVMMFILMIIFGIGQGFLPVAGYNYGARNYDRLLKGLYFTIKVCLVVALFGTFSFIFLGGFILNLFNVSQEVVSIGIKAFRYTGYIMPALGFAIPVNMLYQAMGRGIPATLLSISRQGIFFIPVILILPNLIGLNGVLMAQPIADLCTLIFTALLSISLFKEINRKRNSSEATNDI
ncbi:MAG: MATE family efflux transporter [Clostridia bacterium]|nr:MATE family efflux transporter [Clostridia bacterium]